MSTARHEVGGTPVLYISHVPFEQLGLPTNLGDKPISHEQRTLCSRLRSQRLGLIVGLTGFYWIVKRRQKMAQRRAGRAPED